MLTNDLLHEYGLLDPHRTISREASSNPSPRAKVTSASIQVEQPTTRDDSVSDPSLKRCSESTSIPALAPVTEEGDIPHGEGKEVVKVTDEGPVLEERASDTDQAASHEEDETFIYDDLENLSFTRKELFGELAMSSKPISPVVETSQNIPQTPVTQEMTPVVPAPRITIPQSGSWRVVHTLHTLRIFNLAHILAFLLLAHISFVFNENF